MSHRLAATRVVMWLLVAVTCIAAASSRASAFCREQPNTPPDGPCVEDPDKPFLFWDRGCFTYKFNENFFVRVPGLSEQAARDIFTDSFATWTQLDPQAERFYVEQFAGTTATSKAEFLRDVTNEAVINARTAQEWQALPGHHPRVVALTLLWHDRVTGEILDVDMDLNLGIGRFVDCSLQTCRAGMIDLQNTITHEAGHVFGLGHSDVPNSTMVFSTGDNLSETGKRSLAEDDIEGYHSLELPAWKCDRPPCVCPPPPVLPSKRVQTCGCRSLGSGAAIPRWSLAWLAAIVWFARRRGLVRSHN